MPERSASILKPKIQLPVDLYEKVSSGTTEYISDKRLRMWFRGIDRIDNSTISYVQGYLLRDRSVFINSQKIEKKNKFFQLAPRPVEGLTLEEIHAYITSSTDYDVQSPKMTFLQFVTTNGNDNPYKNILSYISCHVDPRNPYESYFRRTERISIPYSQKDPFSPEQLHPIAVTMLEQIGLHFNLQDLQIILHHAEYKISDKQPSHSLAINYSPSELAERVIMERSVPRNDYADERY